MASSQVYRRLPTRTAPRLSAIVGCLGVLLCDGHLRAESPLTATPPTRPTAVVELAAIERAYADIKLGFDLAGDENGYAILKDTIDLFLGGVDQTKPCEYRVFATMDGLQTVVSVPVNTASDFSKFLQYLWDVDVKTAPVPKPGSIGHVPAAVRTRLQSLKLQPGERIVFSLMDGFMRHDAGYVHLGEVLDAIRLAGGRTGICSNGATLALRIEGDATTSEHRRAAFQKSSQKTLAELTRDDGVSEAGFGLQKALLETQFAGMEVLFSESSLAQLDVTTSQKLKQLKVHAELTSLTGTALAGNVQRIGKSVDAFAGVSRLGAALSCSFNLPANPRMGKSLKNVVQCARSALRANLEQASDKGSDHKAADTEFGDFLLDVADTVASLTDYNGLIRIWPNGDGTLTTVAAIRIDDDTRFQKRLQTMKNQSVVTRTNADSKVPIHKIPVYHWSREYAELFDQEGTVLVAIEQDRVWCAVGNAAVDRLQQALHEAGVKVGGPSEIALDSHAQLQPLSEVWNKIHSRRAGTGKKNAKKTTEKVKPSVANWAAIIADLNLPKIASVAFEKGHDAISITLKREGDKATVVALFEEGTLRFIGKALSKFVANNLN